MDHNKIGQLIRENRMKQALTQRQLAEKLMLSDKTVSKWERGMGCPDVGSLVKLSEILGVDLQALMEGQVKGNEPTGGNMKKLKFYMCPNCGNLLTSTVEAAAALAAFSAAAALAAASYSLSFRYLGS